MYSKIRMAMIMKRFATGTRGGVISFHSVRLPLFQTLVSQHSQHWRCSHGCGLVEVSSSSILFDKCGPFSRGRTTRVCSTVFVGSRQYHGTSILERQKAASRKLKLKLKLKSELEQAEEDAKALTIPIKEQIIAFGNHDQWREILMLYKDQKQHFNASDFADVMSQMARIRQVRRNDRLFEAFLADLNAYLQEHGIKWLGGVRQLSTIVYAIARLGLKPERNSSANQIMTFVQGDETVEWLLESKDPRSVANCVWACGKLGIEAPTLFKRLDEGSEWFMDNGNTQDVANCVVACGTLGIKLPKLFGLLNQRAEWLFKYGTPQGIANCVWACGELGIQAPKLFKVLDKRAKWLMDNGKPQEVSNCVWACGILAVEAPKLFKLLDNRADWLFEAESPHNIGDCAWACGTLGIEAPKLFLLLDQRAEWLMEHGNPQNIANCAWACGRLGIESPKLFQLLDEHAAWLFESENTQVIANCLWACGTLGIVTPKLFKLCDQRAEWLMENGNPRVIATCAWSLAVLGTYSPGFFSALERCIDKFLVDADSQDLCSTCYAIAIHDHVSLNQRDLLPVLWTSLLDRKIGDLPDETLTQILHVQTFSSAYDIQLASPQADLRRQLEEFTFTTQSSTFETNVSNTLLDVGFAHQREVSPLKSIPGLLSIDIACPDRMVAIECDGPSHYLSIIGHVERRENGPTKAKRRLLQHLGWIVINLNSAEAFQHELSKEWLRDKLSEGGVKL